MSLEGCLDTGCCFDCDCDPTKCFAQGYCEYEGPEEEEEESCQTNIKS